MKLKSAYISTLKDDFFSLSIFAGIFGVITLLIAIIARFASPSEVSITTSIGFSTIIYLSVLMMSVNERIGYSFQNGISRKTMFFSRILSFLTLIVALMVASILLELIISNIYGGISIFTQWNSIFKNNSFFGYGVILVIFVSSNLLIGSVCMLMGIVNYRTNKKQKILIYSIIILFFIFALPLVAIYQPLNKLVFNVLKFFVQNYIMLLPVSIVFAIIFFGFTWLLMRKLEIKE